MPVFCRIPFLLVLLCICAWLYPLCLFFRGINFKILKIYSMRKQARIKWHITLTHGVLLISLNVQYSILFII